MVSAYPRAVKPGARIFGAVKLLLRIDAGKQNVRKRCWDRLESNVD